MLNKTIIATIDKIGGAKTARVVRIDSSIHPKYHKRYAKTSRFLVDTGNHVVALGDKVAIEPARPFSKLKSWRITKVLTLAEVVDKEQS